MPDLNVIKKVLLVEKKAYSYAKNAHFEKLGATLAPNWPEDLKKYPTHDCALSKNLQRLWSKQGWRREDACLGTRDAGTRDRGRGDAGT